jgi:hypothetical protein
MGADALRPPRQGVQPPVEAGGAEAAGAVARVHHRQRHRLAVLDAGRGHHRHGQHLGVGDPGQAVGAVAGGRQHVGDDEVGGYHRLPVHARASGRLWRIASPTSLARPTHGR